MGRNWESATRFRRIAQAVLWPVLRVVWGLRVEGLENIPADGPLIVAPNHNAYIDGPVIGVATGLPRRYCLALTKIEMYSVPVIGWCLKQLGSIPLDRKGDVQALRAAIDWLSGGGALIIFPEGTRSRTGQPGRAKAGVGFLASRSKAAVVPVRLSGTRSWPFTRSLRVRFGAPLRFDRPDADRDACRAFSQRVLDAALELPA